jgi:4Fe-4S binding domain
MLLGLFWCIRVVITVVITLLYQFGEKAYCKYSCPQQIVRAHTNQAYSLLYQVKDQYRQPLPVFRTLKYVALVFGTRTSRTSDLATWETYTQPRAST